MFVRFLHPGQTIESPCNTLICCDSWPLASVGVLVLTLLPTPHIVTQGDGGEGGVGVLVTVVRGGRTVYLVWYR